MLWAMASKDPSELHQTISFMGYECLGCMPTADTAICHSTNSSRSLSAHDCLSIAAERDGSYFPSLPYKTKVNHWQGAVGKLKVIKQHFPIYTLCPPLSQPLQRIPWLSNSTKIGDGFQDLGKQLAPLHPALLHCLFLEH